MVPCPQAPSQVLRPPLLQGGCCEPLSQMAQGDSVGPVTALHFHQQYSFYHTV